MRGLCLQSKRHLLYRHFKSREFNTVLCDSDTEAMTNVTHYIPLTDIKPESESKRTYFMFAALRYCGGALNTGLATRACDVERLNNENLKGVIDGWLLEIRQDVAKINNLDYSDVIVTSFSCTETT